MRNIIVILVSMILGAIVGRIACNIMNKKAFTINPVLCTIAGIAGGGIGSWVFYTLRFGDDIKVLALQLAAGVGCAILLLILLAFFRDRDDDEDEQFDE